MHCSARQRQALLLAIAAASFAIVSTAVRTLVRLPAGYGLRAKLEHIAAHPSDYDTLFVGSSILFRGIDPESIEREFNNRGQPTRVFNLGVPGLHAFELDHMLRHLADVGVTTSRLFVEHIPRQFDSLIPVRLTDRSVYWRTPAVTWSALRAIALSNRGWREKIGTSGLQIRLMMRRLGNHAVGSDILRGYLGEDDTYDYLRESELVDQRGYQDPDTLQTEKSATRRRLYLDQRELYKQRLKDARRLLQGWRRDLDATRVLDGYDTEGVRQQFAGLDKIAGEAIVVVPPVLSNVDKAFALQQVDAYPRVISFCDPVAYPKLYARDHRFDHGHLNKLGARSFSRALVRVYLEGETRREMKKGGARRPRNGDGD